MLNLGFHSNGCIDCSMSNVDLCGHPVPQEEQYFQWSLTDVVSMRVLLSFVLIEQYFWWSMTDVILMKLLLCFVKRETKEV